MGINDVTSVTIERQASHLLPRLLGCQVQRQLHVASVSPSPPKGNSSGMWYLLRFLDSRPLVLASKPLILVPIFLVSFLSGTVTLRHEVCGWPQERALN